MSRGWDRAVVTLYECRWCVHGRTTVGGIFLPSMTKYSGGNHHDTSAKLSINPTNVMSYALTSFERRFLSVVSSFGFVSPLHAQAEERNGVDRGSLSLTTKNQPIVWVFVRLAGLSPRWVPKDYVVKWA